VSGHLTRRADSPVELGLQQGELPGDLDGVQGHELEGVHLPRAADVPLDGRRRALERDVVAHAVGLRLQLPLDDLVDGLHPLPHGLACGGRRVKSGPDSPGRKVLGSMPRPTNPYRPTDDACRFG